MSFDTSEGVVEGLRELFPSTSHALLEQVPDGTGANQSRWADVVVMSLWPSRGLDLYGIEVKVSRADFLKELTNPTKSEAIAEYCDFWFVAVGREDIVQPMELPSNWGLIAPQRGKLRVVVKPSRLGAKIVDRAFLAGILRATARGSMSQLALDAAERRGYEKGYKAAGGYWGKELSDFAKVSKHTMRRLDEAINHLRTSLRNAESLKKELGEDKVDNKIDGGETSGHNTPI